MTPERRRISSVLPTAALLAAALAVPASAGLNLVTGSSVPFAVPVSSSELHVLTMTLQAPDQNYNLNTLQLGLFGDVPSQSAKAGLYEDSDLNGLFNPAADLRISTGVSFNAGMPPAAFISTNIYVYTGQTRRFFLTVAYQGFPPGRRFSAGFREMWQLSGNFPFPGPQLSGETIVKLRLPASPFESGASYPVPKAAPVGGGFDTGLFVQNGQILNVDAFGTWDPGAGAVGASGSGGPGGPINGAIGRLMGRIGSTAWFSLGATSTRTATSPGPLYLAMNDSDYSGNSGFLDVVFQVSPSTSPKVWQGGTVGFESLASVGANWIGGRPFDGEKVVVDSATYNVDWDISNVQLAELHVSSAFTNTFTLKPGLYGGYTELKVSSLAVIGGGVFKVNSQGVRVKGSMVVKGSATLDMGASLASGSFGFTTSRLMIGDSIWISSNAFLKHTTGYAEIQPEDWNKPFLFRIENATANVSSPNGFSIQSSSRMFFGPRLHAAALERLNLNPSAAVPNAPYYVFAATGPWAATFPEWSLGPGSGGGAATDFSGAPAGSQLLFKNTNGMGMGTGKENDPNDAAFWEPDGGGSPGTISVTLRSIHCGAACPPNTTYEVFATTVPDGSGNRFFTTASNVSGFPSGPHNIGGLNSPATYYVFAFDNLSGFPPSLHKNRGGYNTLGAYSSRKLILPSGGNVPIDVWVSSRGAVDVNVSNPTSQVGPTRVEVYHGGPTIAQSSFSSAGYGPFATLDAPATADVHVLAYVDVDNDRQLDAFEASGQQNNLSVTRGQQLGVNVTLSGGGSAPGGTLTLSSETMHGGFIGFNDMNPMMLLRFASAGDQSRVSGVQLKFDGSMPAPGASQYWATVYEDSNGDQQLNFVNAANPSGTGDRWLGGASIGPMPGSTATLTFFDPMAIPTGSTRAMIVVLDLFGQRVSSAGVFVTASSSFSVSMGAMAAQPAMYPSGAYAGTRVKVRADMYASNSSFAGGQQARPSVFSGQQIASFVSSGSWRADAGTAFSGAAGVPGTEGQNTLLPSARLGELIGTVQAFGAAGSFHSPWFRVGGGTFPLTVPMDGELRVAINDFENAYFSGNEGSLLVDFAVSGATLGAITGQLRYPNPAAGSMHVFAQRFGTDFTSVTINSANLEPFTIGSLPAGNYKLRAVHATAAGVAGISGNELFVQPGSTRALDVEVYPQTGTISGFINYSGQVGYGDFRVAIATVTDLRGNPAFFKTSSQSGTGAFTLNDVLAPASYYIFAFRDGNYNQKPDGPEPFAYHGTPGCGLANLSACLQPVFLWISSGGIQLNLLDQGTIEGFAQLPGSSGRLVVEAGRGPPGSAGYVVENRLELPIFSPLPPDGRMFFNIGLLRPATDYSLFAFHDADESGAVSAGEGAALSAADISVSSGSRARRDVSLVSFGPPSAPTGFVASSSNTGVRFNWNRVPGATAYFLLRGDNSAAVALNEPASTYFHVVASSNAPSDIIRIAARNDNGQSAAVSISTAYSLAAPPHAAVTPINAAAATISIVNTNPAGTLFRVSRATVPAGPAAVVFVGTATSFVDKSLVPSQYFEWKAIAVNGNGLESAPGNTGTHNTGAAGFTAVSGTITYNGGQLGSRIVVQAATSNTFATLVSSVSVPVMSRVPYLLPASGAVHVRAFVDTLNTGAPLPGAELGLLPANPVTGPLTAQNFTVAQDTVPPASAVGVSAVPGFKQVTLSWFAPNKNADGSNLADLSRFQVTRASGPGGAFSPVSFGGSPFVSSGTLSVTIPETTPGAKLYRVAAVDFGGNQSTPSGIVTAAPSLGGSISGQVQNFTVITAGQIRVTLSSAASPSAAALSEATSENYSFSGLPDGSYYLRAFRDQNGDGALNGDFEPSGTFGGLNAPFPIQIVGGNVVTQANVPICDRSVLLPDAPFDGTLTGGDCPALDKGPGFTTELFALRAGTSTAGAAGLGTQVTVSMTSPFENDLFVLGPNGNVVARDNRPGGAVASFVIQSSGTYLIEPTSFAGDTGTFTVRMRFDGGFAGALAGDTSYSGSKTGLVHMQLFNSPAADASPLVGSTRAAPGAFSFAGLPDGVYYLRGYRDANGNGVRDGGEPSGVYGVSASSLSPVFVTGGVSFPAPPHNVVLADPAVGAIRGAVLYDGGQGGNVRIEAGPSQCDFCQGIKEVVASTVVAPGVAYRLDFLPPATNYSVVAFLDANGNGRNDVLEPVVSSAAVSVVAGASTTVSFILQDPGAGGSAGSSVIVGTIAYSGSSTGTIFVGFSGDPSFRRIDYLLQLPATGYFERPGVYGGTSYYMAAFIDVNGNNSPDEDQGEPQGLGDDIAASAFVSTPTFDNPPFVAVPGAGTVSTFLKIQDPPSGRVAGRVSYGGSSLASNIVVQAYRFAQTGGNPPSKVIARVGGVSSYDYELRHLIATNDYFVQAFVDTNGNGRGDMGEPFGGFNNVSVASGPGSFPTYGIDLEIRDPGSFGATQSAGRLRGHVSYLGTQSGPVYVRFFGNASRKGPPLFAQRITGAPGPGSFEFDRSNIPFGTYYVDAFRDPSDSGVYNPTFHGFGLLKKGEAVEISSNNSSSNHISGDVTDPGQGGSVNAYTGSFAAASGVRFDGGATDIAAAVFVDSASAGGPFFHVMGVTAQNSGVRVRLSKLGPTGALIQEKDIDDGTDHGPGDLAVRQGAGDVYLGGRDESGSGQSYSSTATVTRLDPAYVAQAPVRYPPLEAARGVTLENGFLYIGGANNRSSGNPRDVYVLKINPASWSVVSTGTFTMPSLCQFCGSNFNALAVAPNASAAFVLAEARGQNEARGVTMLVRFDSALNPVASKDITSLNLPKNEGAVMAADAGGVYVSWVPEGGSEALTYKFDNSLVQVASTSFSPIVAHFQGGLGNLKLDTSGYLYSAWQTGTNVNGGDMLLLRYDAANLAFVSSRTFDGLNNTFEDFAFSLQVLDSSNVYMAGGVNNGRNLDYGIVRVNSSLPGAGAASAPGSDVVITTSNAVQYVFGNAVYGGSLVTSGTVRTVLIPFGSEVPIRFATAPFGAARSFLFNNVPYGRYIARSFIDPNENLNPDAGEPAGYAPASGLEFFSGSSLTVSALELCDRRPAPLGSELEDSLTASDCRGQDVPGGGKQRLYTFAGVRGQPVTAEMIGLTFNDTYLTLYGPGGELLRAEDDGAGNGAARITNYVLTRDGLYTLGAAAYAAGVTGSYRLSLRASAGSLGSIAGRVEYSGTQGGAIVVGAFRSPSFSTATAAAREVLVTTRSFSLSGLATGTTYYLGAFIDVNRNNLPDAGEDSGVFGAAGAPNAIMLPAGQNVGGLAIFVAGSTTALASASYLTGSVSYSGTRQGQLVLELWSSAVFSGRPIATRVLPTGVGPFDVSVPGGQPYFLRAFLDSDGDFIPDPNEPSGVYAPNGQGAESVFAAVGQTKVGIDIALKDPGLTAGGAIVGDGSATFLVGGVSTVGAGGFFTATMTYTAGDSGISAGGRVGFTVPPGFPFPFNNVSVQNLGGGTLGPISYQGPTVSVGLTGGTLSAGQQLRFVWNNAFSPCAVGFSTIAVFASQNGTAQPAPLFGGSPALETRPGSASFAQLRDPYFSLTAGALSGERLVETRDLCGNKVPVTSAKTVALRAKRFDQGSSQFVNDLDVGLSSATSVSTTSSVGLEFAAGQSSRTFHVVSVSTGFKNIEMFFDLGFKTTFYFGVTVLPANALTNVRLSTAPGGATASSAAITLSGAGVPNQVFFDFSLGDANQSWHVVVDSAPFKDGEFRQPIWERWGFGQPRAGEIAWDGRFSPWINGGARVPNGLYYGKVELGPGGIKDDSLRVSVSLPQFAGGVFDSGVSPAPPLGSARLNVYGPAGFFTVLSDADGKYALPGLGAGGWRLQVSRDGYADGAVQMTLNGSGQATAFAPLTAGLQVSSNASGGLDLFMARAPRLVVVPALGVGVSTQAFDQWGGLQIVPSTGSGLSTLFGPLRLKAGTTSFDDGGQWDPATQQFVARQLIAFSVPVGSYSVTADLSGLSRSSATVYVGAEGARVDLPAFQKKSSVAGQVYVNPNPNGAFVSVSAVPLSTSNAGAGSFAGAYLQPGATHSLYLLGGLDAGAYMLRAQTQGLSTVSSGPIALAANEDRSQVNFPVFGAGASISGNVTLQGTTTSGSTVYINAWSPGSMNFGYASVQVPAGVDQSAAYNLTGLDSGATYQLFAHVDGQARYDRQGGFPISLSPPVTQNLLFQQSSGTVRAFILLPSGSVDFGSVTLDGRIVSSLRVSEVGQTFEVPDITFGGDPSVSFRCGNDTPPAGGSCPAGVFSGTFTVRGLDTQTVEARFHHKTSGQFKRVRIPIVNGSTTTVTVDLSASTRSISGSIVNQVASALFDTNPEIAASSINARVTALRRELDQFSLAISTSFDAASTRVGFIGSAGTFTITNVPDGVWLVRTEDLRGCASCEIAVPAASQFVRVSGADVSSVTLALSDGYAVSGAISLADDIQDSHVFDLQVLNVRQEIVRSTAVYLGDAASGVRANSVSYSFSNLPAGQFYTLLARASEQNSEKKYVGRPQQFPSPALSPNGLQANVSGVDVSMKRAAFIVGKVKDAATGELIGANNATLLAPNFRVTATANPWIEGGFVIAASSIAGRPIFGDGTFRVGPLMPDVSYDLRLAQTSWDPSFLASGSQNYAPVTLAGLKPQSGETRDVGVVPLSQGQSITGVVRSSATGAALGNIKVLAKPSFGAVEFTVQSFTNPQGRYSLWVSSSVSNQYNITVAPRDGNTASDGAVYGQVIRPNVSLLTATTADFLLQPLQGGVTGQVVVADAGAGGQLSYPFGGKKGFPAAAINMQPAGTVPVENPLGDIAADTDERGFFRVPGLSTGTYALKATSLGYSVFNATAAVTAAGFRVYVGSDTPSNNLTNSVITLQRGATVTGRIQKSDGSAPSSTEISGVAAANFSQGQFVVGTLEIDPTARTVSGYTLSGFKTGVSYDIVLLSGERGKEVSFPAEGDDISFLASESSTTKSINLTFQPPALDCLATSKASDGTRARFTIQIDCFKPLRNDTPADNDVAQMLTVATFTAAGGALTAPNGSGTLSGGTIANTRRKMTAVYQIGAGETRFSLRLRAASSEIDPKTGAPFSVDKVFDFFAGLDAHADGRITNIDGGSVEMPPSGEDELLGLDERSRLDMRPGTFADQGGGVVSTQTVNVTVTKGRDQQLAQTLHIKSRGYALTGLAPESPSSYPDEVWAAMRAYRTQASTTQVGGANPLSSFYSIFLPAGISHQLRERADLTLSYTTALSTATSPDSINVWFYNAVLGRYVLENVDRRLDAVNKTITVSVDHFSTFVVLDSTPVLTAPIAFNGEDMYVANFPNPADCITHSNITRNAFLFGSGGTHAPFVGTMIRTSVPIGPAADLKINIYNVAGEKVRTITQGTLPGSQTYYTPWNCANDDGKTVASGVYIAEVVWGGKRKFMKIAIIKGSGL